VRKVIAKGKEDNEFGGSDNGALQRSSVIQRTHLALS